MALEYLPSLVPPPDGLMLELTHDSPSHSNLIPAGRDLPIYRITTEYAVGQHPLTIVTNASGNFLASLEWRHILADLVVFGEKDAKPQKISDWMKSGVFRGQRTTFEDNQGRKYYWRCQIHGRDNAKGSLTLYADDCPDYPIVTYLRPPGLTRTSEVGPGEQRPKLILQPRAVEIQDLAVVSWLFLEKARRMKLGKQHIPLWSQWTI